MTAADRSPVLGDPTIHRLEADRLHRALFDEPPPAVLVERFVAVRSRRSAAPDAWRRYTRVLEADVDLEALELAGRRTGALPLLVEGMRLMVYLAETLPEHQAHFVNRRPRPVAGWWSLVAGALRGGFKLARGRWLLRGLRDA